METSAQVRTATFSGPSTDSHFLREPKYGQPLFKLDFNIFATTIKANGNFVRMTTCPNLVANKSL
jgi:hypothetical protein